MKRLASPLFVLLQLIILASPIPLLPSGGGAPSVEVTSPADGFISTSGTVNVTGTASGSEAGWLQSSTADFIEGAGDQLEADKNGTLLLNRTRMAIYDDFNDDDLDANLWSWSDSPELTISETGSELVMNGTVTTGWSQSSLTSERNIPGTLSADLRSISGTDYEVTLYLYQDSQTYVFFRLYSYRYSNQTNQTRPELYWGYGSPGSWDNFWLGSLPAGNNNFKISTSANTTTVHLNGVQKGSAYMMMQYSQIRIEASSWGNSSWTSWMDARWDNVKAGNYYAETGNFTSIAYDTACAGPVLKAVRWNASVPNGTGLSVQVRSSDERDMASATGWTAVSNGQVAGLPAVKRYLQYRLAMTSADGQGTPAFRDIELTYGKPVAKVEVSIDGNATWIPATGTVSWSVRLQLPDNTSFIWVRVTDAADDSETTSLRLEVDTTAPTGGVIIDGNAPFSTDHAVTLTLPASDHYGVVSMMASEEPGLGDATWADYAASLAFRLSAGDGQKTVHVKFRDSNGWESAVYDDSILVDTMPSLGGVQIDGGAEYTRNATVTLGFNATDPSGVSSMLVSNSLDFAGAQWMDYEPSLRWGLTAGNGERSVYAKFKDAGGHVSQPAEDSILADLNAPAVALAINGGAAYTRYRNVSVTLAPTDNYQAVSMQVREGPGSFPADFSWVPFQPGVELVLSPPDGQKVVSARLLDAAGNAGPVTTGSITLDTAAPVTSIAGFPEVSFRAGINVSWDGTDATSGVQWYDVQYRIGDGPWTNWLLHTCSTSAVFTGEDTRTYSFRARALDRAANQEEFPATVDNKVTVSLTKGALTIASPAPKATVSGMARISGRCQPDSEGNEPLQVLVRVDDGPWQLAEGTSDWSLYLDTAKLGDGSHVIRVRTFDGAQYSAETERAITVSNAASRPFDAVPVLAVALVLAVVALVAMAFMVRRKPVPEAQPVQ